MIFYLTTARTWCAAFALYFRKDELWFVFLFPRLFGKNGDAVNACLALFEGLDFFLGKVFEKNIIRDHNGFFFLQGNVRKARLLDKAKIVLFLDGTGYTAGVDFSIFL